MHFIQDLIHKLEAGAGARVLRIVLLVLAILAMIFLYDLRAYKNFASPEAMDAAQLARNISEGKGFTTLFLRPFSLFLVQKHNQSKAGNGLAGADSDFALIQTNHPDLANPPVYPVLLAGLMKVLPFHFTVEPQKVFWGDGGSFQRYEPEFLITVFNELLLVGVTLATFFIARKMFDATVAWISALLVFGCDVLWRFSISGLSTMLLLLIFLGLFWLVLKIEEAARETQPNANKLFALAAAAGLAVGLGALTRYSFGGLIIPLLVFLILFGGQRRAGQALAAFAAFAVVLLPWILRNESVSGTLFGTAGYALVEDTFVYPGFHLERAINPDLASAFWLKPYIYKLLGNGRAIFQNDLPKLGGSWAAILFLAGLLLGFRSLTARRLRYFLLMCLSTLIIFQALGRTQLADETPDINSENLLVLAVPLAFIFSTVFFLTFLDQMKLAVPQLRHFIIGAFIIVCTEPLIATLSPPRSSTLAFPPYYPPDVQKIGGWMKENELVMSDVPWAVAWYGHRQSVWLSLNAKDDFFAINDYLKPVLGLYLTMETMDGKLLTDCEHGGENSWGNFALNAVAKNQLPPGFPLRRSPTSIATGLFVTDIQRW